MLYTKQTELAKAKWITKQAVNKKTKNWKILVFKTENPKIKLYTNIKDLFEMIIKQL
jgi:DNA-binding XRE family transcriptional regulator